MSFRSLSFGATVVPVEGIVDKVGIGKLTVPDEIQPKDVTVDDAIALFDSLLHGFPIGAITVTRNFTAQTVVDGAKRVALLAAQLLADDERPTWAPVMPALAIDLAETSAPRLIVDDGEATSMPLGAVMYTMQFLAWERRMRATLDEFVAAAILDHTANPIRALRKSPVAVFELQRDPGEARERLNRTFRR